MILYIKLVMLKYNCAASCFVSFGLIVHESTIATIATNNMLTWFSVCSSWSWRSCCSCDWFNSASALACIISNWVAGVCVWPTSIAIPSPAPLNTCDVVRKASISSSSRPPCVSNCAILWATAATTTTTTTTTTNQQIFNVAKTGYHSRSYSTNMYSMRQ